MRLILVAILLSALACVSIGCEKNIEEAVTPGRGQSVRES